MRTLDNVIPAELLRAVAATWPRDDWSHWHRYRDQTADKFLHGAGLHMSKPGGFLACHLDGATHPLTGWSRVANAVLFVDDWQPEWGGALQMVADGQVASECVPQRGRIAMFATGDTAWHQVSQVTGPKPRRTISLFWWSEVPAESTRSRAEFVASGCQKEWTPQRPWQEELLRGPKALASRDPGFINVSCQGQDSG
ncbi:MAG: 2OG-Fe(II) oxygenase [Caulobacteraceae bacterium]|nr:2OG-Fe(II) oxygenase [Caulobacteraceae bacterium]